MYFTRLMKMFKSVRTWAFTLVTSVLTLMSTMPNEVKSILSSMVSEQWLTDHWTAITAFVALSGASMFSHGVARKGSSKPLEDR